jgi:hypothetical protein
MRETGIFTGTTSSLCLSLRQLPDRYAIRAGRNLPDKEFRSDFVTSTRVEGLVISANLCMSPCSTDYIFTSSRGAWRVVSEDSSSRWSFLLIICTFAFSRGDPSNPRLNKTQITRIKADYSFVAKDTQTFQHIAKFN